MAISSAETIARVRGVTPAAVSAAARCNESGSAAMFTGTPACSSQSPRRLSAMRGIIVLGIGLIIAAWVDHSYYGGMYGHAASDMIGHIAARFKH
jgi:hypothetical protein